MLTSRLVYNNIKKYITDNYEELHEGLNEKTALISRRANLKAAENFDSCKSIEYY